MEPRLFFFLRRRVAAERAHTHSSKLGTALVKYPAHPCHGTSSFLFSETLPFEIPQQREHTKNIFGPAEFVAAEAAILAN